MESQCQQDDRSRTPKFPLEDRPLLNTAKSQLNFELSRHSPPSSPNTSPPSSDFHTAGPATSSCGSSGYHTPWEQTETTLTNLKPPDFTILAARTEATAPVTNSSLFDDYSLPGRRIDVIAPTYAHSVLGEYPEFRGRFPHLHQHHHDSQVPLQVETEEPSSKYSRTELSMSQDTSRNSSLIDPVWEASAAPFSFAMTNQKEERRRNASPSGLSQSSIISGMEWDPSADVGSTTHHPTPLYHNSKQLDAPGTIHLPVDDARIEQNRPGVEPLPKEPGAERKTLLEPISFSSMATTSPPKDNDGHSHSFSNVSRRDVGTGTVSMETPSSPRGQRRAPRQVGNLPTVHLANKSVQTEEPGKGRSQSHHHRPTRSDAKLPFKVPSRLGRVPDKPVGQREYDSNVVHSSSSSGGLTPTCSFINAIVRSGEPITAGGKLSQAIDAHRHDHISNVRRELRRVIKLSELLCSRGLMNQSPSSSGRTTSDASQSRNSENSTMTGSSSEELKGIPNTSEEHTPRFPPPQRHQRKPPAKTTSNSDETVDELIRTFHKVLQTSTPVPRSSRGSSGTQKETGGCQTLPENQQQRPPTPRDKKRDELSKACRTILECLGQGGGGQTLDSSVPSSTTKSHGRHNRQTQKNAGSGKSHKECVTVKPPVSYFLPLPCPFKPIWIRPPPPTAENPELTSSDKENEGECDGEEQERNGLPFRHNFSLTHAEFLKRAKARANHIASVREVRKKRGEVTRNWIGSHGTANMSRLESSLPPKGEPVMSFREIRKETREKYLKLPEVQEKKLKSRVEKEKETNRVISRYFSGRLQEGVLKGRVNVELNKSLIRK